MLNVQEKTRTFEVTSRTPTSTLGDLIIAQADGELLRCSRDLSAHEQWLLETASALVALAATQRRWPAWVDLADGPCRVIAVAFDEQIVFMTVGGRDEPCSRAEFVERARSLVSGGD